LVMSATVSSHCVDSLLTSSYNIIICSHVETSMNTRIGFQGTATRIDTPGAGNFALTPKSDVITLLSFRKYRPAPLWQDFLSAISNWFLTNTFVHLFCER
jgi:hypothetical protein